MRGFAPREWARAIEYLGADAAAKRAVETAVREIARQHPGTFRVLAEIAAGA